VTGGQQFNAHERGRRAHVEQELLRRLGGMTVEQRMDALAHAYAEAVTAHMDAAERRMMTALDAFGDP
jgi:hypothetical protein